MKTVIQEIIKNPKILGRFFNTLSLLEYIGARKILKSQMQEKLDSMLLNHVAEEIRHAQVLKRLALKYAPELCATYAVAGLLCGDAARSYFQAVDHAAYQEFGESNSWHCYLYTTYLIEKRADWLYSLIDEVLLATGNSSVFRGILVEEQRHLAKISQWLEGISGAKERIKTLRLIEEQAFMRWMQAMAKEIKVPEAELIACAAL